MRDVTIQRGECRAYVEGMEMACPLCGTRVRSGEHHHCKVAEPPARRQPISQPQKDTK